MLARLATSDGFAQPRQRLRATDCKVHEVPRRGGGGLGIDSRTWFFGVFQLSFNDLRRSGRLRTHGRQCASISPVQDFNDICRE